MMKIERFFGLLMSGAIACIAVAGCSVLDPMQRKIKDGQALFDERCKTVAGQKIYRTVENVEGVVLLKVRPQRTEAQLADRDWPGAAFAKEYPGEEFIQTFLAYERAPGNTDGKPKQIDPKTRGFITTSGDAQDFSQRPGYRYVDVVDEKTGERWRYSGSEKIVGKKDVTAPNVQVDLKRDPNYDLNIYRYTLDRKPAPADGPRYGVMYEDHVIPEERALGLASSTVKVVDLKTHEVLGEFTRYAWTPAVLYTGPRGANPAPWLSAYSCGDSFIYGAGTKTRLFVDQVVKPGKEK